MQFSTLALSALTGAAATVSARALTPAAARNAQRSSDECADAIVPPTLAQDNFIAAAGQVNQNTDLTFDVGDVPAGPCTLFGKFEAGLLIDSTVEPGSNNRLDVLNGDGSVVGSFGPLVLDDNFRVVEDTFATINSVVCAPSLTFTFRLANDAGGQGINNLGFFFSDIGEENGFFVQVGDQCPLPTFESASE